MKSEVARTYLDTIRMVSKLPLFLKRHLRDWLNNNLELKELPCTNYNEEFEKDCGECDNCLHNIKLNE